MVSKKRVFFPRIIFCCSCNDVTLFRAWKGRLSIRTFGYPPPIFLLPLISLSSPFFCPGFLHLLLHPFFSPTTPSTFAKKKRKNIRNFLFFLFRWEEAATSSDRFRLFSLSLPAPRGLTTTGRGEVLERKKIVLSGRIKSSALSPLFFGKKSRRRISFSSPPPLRVKNIFVKSAVGGGGGGGRGGERKFTTAC